ncbi:MAG: hypothetical protein ABI618_06205 [Nitrospirota bacterium]
MPKNKSGQKQASKRKLGPVEILRAWLMMNKEANVSLLRGWMKEKKIPGLIAHLTNDENYVEHCRCAVVELKISKTSRSRR